MTIEFFKESCKSSTRASQFGLYDNEATYASIVIENHEIWQGEVENSKEKKVVFFAIDKCLEIKDENGNLESTCDCLLKQEKQLIFVELKSWKKGRWVKEGREQITNTISLFKKSNIIDEYQVKAHICNNKRPRSHTGHAVNIQQFKDETGFILSTNNKIEIR